MTDPIGPHNHVIPAFITSRLPENLLDTDLIIDSEGENFIGTGLRVTSTLRLHRVMTVTTSIIKRELGTLADGMQSEVPDKLKKLFGYEQQDRQEGV